LYYHYTLFSGLFFPKLPSFLLVKLALKFPLISRDNSGLWIFFATYLNLCSLGKIVTCDHLKYSPITIKQILSTKNILTFNPVAESLIDI
ncbi:hypothetical protein, partial [Bacillus toyonensis]|uniref:hypothetical protein n=1 Tax=Bacillus toyonensis TaxID=155322 RepID=UPI001C54C1F8